MLHSPSTFACAGKYTYDESFGNQITLPIWIGGPVAHMGYLGNFKSDMHQKFGVDGMGTFESKLTDIKYFSWPLQQLYKLLLLNNFFLLSNTIKYAANPGFCAHKTLQSV